MGAAIAAPFVLSRLRPGPDPEEPSVRVRGHFGIDQTVADADRYVLVGHWEPIQHVGTGLQAESNAETVVGGIPVDDQIAQGQSVHLV